MINIPAIIILLILAGFAVYFAISLRGQRQPSDEEQKSTVDELVEAVAASAEGTEETEEPEAEETQEQEQDDRIGGVIESPVNNYGVLEKLDPDILEILNRKFADLPPLPRAAMDLLPMLSHPSTNARDIARVVSADPLLAGKILRRVNSSFYALRDKINSIQHAVMLIGFDNIRSITLRESFDTMVTPEATEDLTANLLWAHSAAISLIGKHLALRVRGADPELVTTAGLLHDIGLLVMMATDRLRLSDAFKLSVKERMPLCESEEQVFGFNHQVLGEMLAQKWNLSDELAVAIGHHHSPYSGEEPDPVAGTIWFAHIAASQLGYAYRSVHFPDNICEEFAAELGLKWPVIEHITQGLLRELQKATSFWEVPQLKKDSLEPELEDAEQYDKVEP